MDEKIFFKTFRSKKVLTIDQLMDMMKCSSITVRRRLKKWKTYTSINKNGRYYALPDVPVFNENGLWSFSTVFFSKNGNLTKTIIHLIKNSKMGLSAMEISRLVGISPYSFMITKLQELHEIRREKCFGRFVYFFNEYGTYAMQVSQRFEVKNKENCMPSDADAVTILVHFIKYPNADVDKLASKIAEFGKPINAAIIKRLLEHHDLLKKTQISKQ